MPTITMMPEGKKWLTTAEVAGILGKGIRTIQEMAKDGRLRWKPSDEPGAAHNARVYDAEDVETLLSGGTPRKPSSPRALTTAAASAETGTDISVPDRDRTSTKRTFAFSAPEGKVSVSAPAELSDESRQDVVAFLQLVIRQVSRVAKVQISLDDLVNGITAQNRH